MEIIYRIGFPHDQYPKKRVKELGIKILFEENCFFDINESDERWPEIKELAKEYDSPFFCRTEFTEDELESSQFIKVDCVKEFGYPMPHMNNEFIQIVYDINKYCIECGAGRSQIEPFYIKSKPKIGKYNAFKLIWVEDEIFVSKELYFNVFKKFDIDYIEILNFKNKIILNDYVQLKINEKVSLDMKNKYSGILYDYETVDEIEKGFMYEKCPHCETKKYMYNERDFFPRVKEFSNVSHIYKTNEFFGGGGWDAKNAVIITNDLYKELIKFDKVSFEYRALQN